MKDNYLLKLNRLVLGIKAFLAKNHSSLSVDQLATLNQLLIDVNELKKIEKSSDRRIILSKFFTDVIKAFGSYKVLKKIQELLEDIID